MDDDEITTNVQDVNHPQHGTGQQDQFLFGQTRKVLDGHQTAGGDVEHGPLASLAQELAALQHTDFGRRGSERPPGCLVADAEMVSQVALDPSFDVARTEGQAVQSTEERFDEAEVWLEELPLLVTQTGVQLGVERTLVAVEVYERRPSLGHPTVTVEGRQSMPILLHKLFGCINVAAQVVELGGIRQLPRQTLRLDLPKRCCQVDLGRCDEPVNGGGYALGLRSVPRVVQANKLVSRSGDRGWYRGRR